MIPRKELRHQYSLGTKKQTTGKKMKSSPQSKSKTHQEEDQTYNSDDLMILYNKS